MNEGTRRERDLRILQRVGVLLRRGATRCEWHAAAAPPALARELCEEAAVTRALDREVQGLIRRLEGER